MKKLIFTVLLLLLSIMLYSQDYGNICTKGVTLYIDDAGNLQMCRYDSLQVTPDHDSVFTSFPTLLYNYTTGIADSAVGSILGRKIIKKHDGWFLFFNKDGDTIFLDTRPKQHVLWKFFNLPNNGYIGAKITSITYDSIMGVQDSVKVIMFQAYDSQNNPVSHPFNGKFLKLSKHYGLSLVYNFWIFPVLSSSFELCGKTNPEIGIQPLRMIDVYNYDIGDEFHYHEVYQNFDYHGNHSDSKIMVKVVSKSMAEDSSGVTYVFSICYSGWYSLFPTGGGKTSGSFDKTVTYNFKALEDKYYFDKLPDEFFCYRTWDDGTGLANRYSSRVMSYNSVPRVQNRINEMVYARNSATGNQWVPLSTAFPQAYVDRWNTFASGLGLTSRFDHETWGSISDSTLVYFKKANETSGTPIAKDCNALIGKQENDSDLHEITVKPNPIMSETTIILSGYNLSNGLHYAIYDYSGKKVREADITSLTIILSRTGLSNGLYIFVICDRNGNVKGKIKILRLFVYSTCHEVNGEHVPFEKHWNQYHS